MSPALRRFQRAQRLSGLSKAASFDSRVCLRRRDASESSNARLGYALHPLNCVTSAIRTKSSNTPCAPPPNGRAVMAQSIALARSGSITRQAHAP
ncbi:hypothetical protein XCCB100_1073 [Xanthomonas campestris pv. campestris]|uniref:Uncharacterized protein n=1 Tax=Xanthomonas campestris pv. campestris (strain B100) TaxID=509169 RepID=B0RPN6_XANCB|nr:hypothetical protein XCCB100_1073 [Xanthomonas campestris pv. campestris]